MLINVKQHTLTLTHSNGTVNLAQCEFKLDTQSGLESIKKLLVSGNVVEYHCWVCVYMCVCLQFSLVCFDPVTLSSIAGMRSTSQREQIKFASRLPNHLYCRDVFCGWLSQAPFRIIVTCTNWWLSSSKYKYQ